MKRLTHPTPLLTTRVLLATLLLFGADVLAWTHPTTRPFAEWLVAAVTDYALACLVLDLIARYRVRDLFGAMTLAGITALVTGLLLNPAYAFAELPRTFVTRTMGAQALIHLEMLGLFLWLTGAVKWGRWLIPAGVAVGLAWGVWTRHWPVDAGAAVVEWTTVFIYGLGMVAIVSAWRVWARSNADALSGVPITASENASPLLSRVAWGYLALWGIGLFVLRLLQGVLDTGGVIIIALVLTLCAVIVWFRGRNKGETLLDGHLPPQPRSSGAWFGLCAAFLLCAALAYQAPAVQVLGITPFIFVGLGFTAYGLLWLPTVALVIGVQAYMRQITQRML